MNKQPHVFNPELMRQTVRARRMALPMRTDPHTPTITARPAPTPGPLWNRVIRTAPNVHTAPPRKIRIAEGRVS